MISSLLIPAEIINMSNISIFLLISLISFISTQSGTYLIKNYHLEGISLDDNSTTSSTKFSILQFDGSNLRGIVPAIFVNFMERYAYNYSLI